MSQLLFCGTRSILLKKYNRTFLFCGTRSTFVEVNLAMHVTDLYILYITLRCSNVNIFP